MKCSECESTNLVAQYQADPKEGGYAPGEEIPATLIGIECGDCGALQ